MSGGTKGPGMPILAVRGEGLQGTVVWGACCVKPAIARVRVAPLGGTATEDRD
jgi:hypothetical protein